MSAVKEDPLRMYETTAMMCAVLRGGGSVDVVLTDNWVVVDTCIFCRLCSLNATGFGEYCFSSDRLILFRMSFCSEKEIISK